MMLSMKSRLKFTPQVLVSPQCGTPVSSSVYASHMFPCTPIIIIIIINYYYYYFVFSRHDFSV